MFGFGKKNNDTEQQPLAPKTSWLGRLKTGLSKTRQKFTSGLKQLLTGKTKLDDDVLEIIETQLLSADVGFKTTETLLENLKNNFPKSQDTDADSIIAFLKSQMIAILTPFAKPLEIAEHKPFVVLTVGINGVGKTTTIAKLAHHFKAQNKKVLFAAGDTFRAAAIEQLTTWADRQGIDIIAQRSGSDSASVIYDAIDAAVARQVDIVFADTAGRLHTQQNLMTELEKIKRVAGKKIADAPHEVLMVVDATTGQNAINQVREFNQCVDLTGLVVTKLDGSAKGGIVFSLINEFNLPIRYIGVGEAMEDLQAFSAKEFVDALFSEETD